MLCTKSMCLAADGDLGIPYTTAGVNVRAASNEITPKADRHSLLPRACTIPTISKIKPRYQYTGAFVRNPNTPGFTTWPIVAIPASHSNVPARVQTADASSKSLALNWADRKILVLSGPESTFRDA